MTKDLFNYTFIETIIEKVNNNWIKYCVQKLNNLDKQNLVLAYAIKNDICKFFKRAAIREEIFKNTIPDNLKTIDKIEGLYEEHVRCMKILCKTFKVNTRYHDKASFFEKIKQQSKEILPIEKQIDKLKGLIDKRKKIKKEKQKEVNMSINNQNASHSLRETEISMTKQTN